MRTLVKLGGNAAQDDAVLEGVAGLVRRTARPPVVVHGGGSQINAVLRERNLTTPFLNGLRVTPPEALDAVVHALCGRVGPMLVASLRERGLDAVSYTPESEGVWCIQAHPKDRTQYGEVGTVTSVCTGRVERLLNAGMVPVMPPLGEDTSGALLNVNADEAALALAAALKVHRILMISDVPAVLVDGSPISHLEAARAELLLRDGVIAGGMAVKVREALRAVTLGIDVVIGDASALGPSTGARLLDGAEGPTGTIITADRSECAA